MKLYIGADHNGFACKQQLTAYLRQNGYAVVDEDARQRQPEDDFPQFAGRVITAMRGDTDFEEARGVLICGSGQGMCMAANRFKGIRAALAFDQEEARASRNDEDSNVLCLSSRYTDFETLVGIVHTWLMTPYAGAPRYKRRIQELDELGG